MLLVKGYQPTKNKTLNNEQCIQSHPDSQICNLCVGKEYKNLKYTTTSLSVFDNLKPQDLFQLFDEQLKAATEEANIHLKYSYLNHSTYTKTLEQYRLFFFYQNHAYLKEELKTYISSQFAYDNTFITTPKQPSTPPKPKPTPEEMSPEDLNDLLNEMRSKNQRGVSRQAIRNITGYSYNAVPSWSKTKEPIYVQWQHKLLEDMNDLVIVNGSRQMGKSFTIAERCVEESHLPNNDMLVGGFTTNTTNVIRNYVLKYIKKFPANTFTHYKGERYIVNNKTGSKIYFRTLSDDAQSILGMTLKLIIVDEAQLVDEFVFEEVLLPTLSTTGGRLIMILTPGRKRSGYAFKKIMEIRKGLIPSASLYDVDITQNPFIHPKKRAEIMARQHEPGMRRQYFCEWNDGGDNLFNFEKSSALRQLSNEGYFTLGIDPARLRDRSGYSLIYTHEGSSQIIYSGFVPDSHKKDWGLQAIFYKQLIESYTKKGFSRWYNVIDVSGVGDGVQKIFQDAGIRFSGMIRYTAGATETSNGIRHNVGKSLLINKLLDMIQEGHISIYEPTNKDLLEEASYINETESKSGLIGMETSFFDDITNATMISTYLVIKLGLLNRRYQSLQKSTSGSKIIDAIEQTRDEKSYRYQQSTSSCDAW